MGYENKITKYNSLKELGYKGTSGQPVDQIVKDYNDKVNKLSKKHMQLNLLINEISNKISKSGVNTGYTMSNL